MSAKAQRKSKSAPNLYEPYPDDISVARYLVTRLKLTDRGGPTERLVMALANCRHAHAGVAYEDKRKDHGELAIEVARDDFDGDWNAMLDRANWTVRELADGLVYALSRKGQPTMHNPNFDVYDDGIANGECVRDPNVDGRVIVVRKGATA